MTMFRSTFLAGLAIAALACGGKKPAPQQPPPTSGSTPTPGKLDVTIASVTLADDCGGGPTTIPQVQSSTNRKPSAGGMAMSMSEPICQQSSVQLRVANGTTAAADLTLKKVELLDSSGKVLRELTPRAPSKWTGDAYQAWDGKVAPDAVLQVSYSLSDPSVSAGTEYTVRVVVTSADGEKTMEQKTTSTIEAPAELPPGAVT